MPYEYAEWEEEPEPQASSSRGGVPPRKLTGVSVLDPPGPPKRSPGPLAALPVSFLLRVIAGLILAGLGLTALFLVFFRH